jgi:hypothetical protein
MFTEQLEPFFKNAITFNNNNKIIQVKSTSLNPLSNQWQNERMNEYAYDSKGNNTYYRESAWIGDSNDYKPITSYSYTYNASNKVTLEIDTMFDISTPLIYKIDYTYDTKGNNTLKTTSRWYGTQWQLSSKDEYTFDANNNNTLHISYDYDWNSTWIVNEKNEYSIDANGNPILVITYSWDNSLNQWINIIKRLTTYNSSINFSDVAIPLVQHGNLVSLPKNAITSETTQYYIDGQWVNDSKTNYYYKDFTPSTSIKEMKLLQTTNVFPNPSAGNFTVSANQAFTKIEVYDLTGKLAYTKQIGYKGYEVEIDLSELNNGIYFLNSETVNGGVSKSRIVINK